MNREEIKNEIKNEIKKFAKNILSKFQKVEVKFMDAKLADGTIISVEGELITGAIAMLVDESGQKLPMPIGNYTLEDGTTFEVVDNMGTVGEVEKAGTNGEEAPATPAMPQEQIATPVAKVNADGTPAPSSIVETRTKETRFASQEEAELHIEIMEKEFKEKIENIEAKFSNVEKENIENVTALKAEIAEQKEVINTMFELVKKIADMPAEKPTETITNKFKRFDAKASMLAFKEDLRNQIK